jgi:hypothetical protein
VLGRNVFQALRAFHHDAGRMLDFNELRTRAAAAAIQ